MANDVPKEFFDLADRFIHLANDLTKDHDTSRVSAVILYAAARYNAHCLIARDRSVAENREAAAQYFVDQYRSMLEDNIAEFLAESKSPSAEEAGE
jgi:hypothetical protein